MIAKPCDGVHEAIENHTVGVDPDVIPYGAHILIDGIEYIAEDTGNLVEGNVIDVYVEHHDDALKRGVEYKEIFIRN